MRESEDIASGLEMRELTLHYWFFQLAEIFFFFFAGLDSVNLKAPGRTSEESHEIPNVCSCLQMPPRGESPSSWKEKSAGKIPGKVALLGEQRLEAELSWKGQWCLGEAGEQPWLCYFLWLWAENYRGSPGRRGRVILMEAQFSSAGRRHGWM